MALGKYNRIILNLTREVSITGNGNERAVAGPHAILPCDAVLERVDVSAYSVQTASSIQVYAYPSVSSAYAVLSSAVSLASGTLTGTGTILESMINYSKGQEFSLSENTTNSATVVGISVQLTFRVKGA